MKKVFSKLTATVLAVLILVSVVPAISVSAAVTGGKFENAQLDIVTNKTSTLAPGVTQDMYTVYDKNGDQVKMFAATMDMNVDTVKLFASYKDMENTSYGMSKLTEQVSAFNEKAENGDEYYKGTVVAGINASYYNMVNGKPTGAFVMNGNDVTTESEGNKYGYFAVMKDGSVKIGKPGEYSSDKDNIQEAIGIYHMLIIDGNIVSGLDDTTKYPRQTIGITDEGKVILMTADGSQAPKSIGLTIKEQAQVMADLGCVWAGHLDGGGSCTYGAKLEGADDFQIVNNPSDGSERSVSNGFIVVSTAVESKTFDHVAFETESEYVTPGTPVKVSVNGVSASGNSAEIPENLTYSVTNGTFADGVVTADNVGDVVVTAMLDGKSVGTVTLHAVVPDKIEFNQSSMVVPYGKTVTISLTATYGINTVAIKDSDISFTLGDNAIGSLDGCDFTAANESSVTSTTITATVVGTDVSATANISIGKGSEVLYDYEDGELGNWELRPWSSTPNVKTNLSVCDAENGQVHSGDHALALNMDFTQEYGTGYMMASLHFPEDIHLENALRVGFWVYLPEEFTSLWARYSVYNGPFNPNALKTNRVNGGTFDETHYDQTATGFVYSIEESGWYYYSLDISKYPDIWIYKDAFTIEFYASDRDGADFGYTYVTSDNKQVNTNPYGKYTLYVDDFTVDYSAAVEDREAPVFGDVKVFGDGEGSTVIDRLTQACTEQTIPVFTNNKLTITSEVSEDTVKSNATGLDAASAKCYVDGYEVPCKYSNGSIILENHTFTNGVHTVRFVISDNAGNSRSVVRKINVEGSVSSPTIQLVPKDPTADKISAGSLYYVDLKTPDLANVDNVSVTLDLNGASKWALEGMKVANGFEASYEYVGSENGVTINFKRTDETVEDTDVLASIPVRAWYHEDGVDPVEKWKNKWFCPVDVRIDVDRGKMTMLDGEEITFTSDRIRVDTEIYGSYAVLNANGDYANKTSWHIHTAEAMEDKAATCTENGYTGRTYCAECNSVVDWGTIIPATGHSYDFVDGILQCTECGKLFNGVYTDGKTYSDGVATSGWAGESYYVEGEKLTGIQLVDGYYYNFGDNGVCPDKVKYTGLFYDDSVSAWRYSKVGELYCGWIEVDGNWHFIDGLYMYAVSGTYRVGKATFTFDEQGMTKGAWYTTEQGTRYYYGPSFYRAYNPGYMKLVEIDGVTYNFDYNGYITPGIWALRDSTALYRRVFEFASDGSLVKNITENSVVTCEDAIYYINTDGVVPIGSEPTGIVKVAGNYYYVLPSGKVAMNSTRCLNTVQTNGLVQAGEYTFGADGKMEKFYTGIKNVDGVDYYYLEGKPMKNSTGLLVQVDDDIYYVTPMGKIKKNFTDCITATKANGLVEPGQYTFGADGKMEKFYTGIKNVDGVDYYYLDGKVMKNSTGLLVQVDDDIYYVTPMGKIKKNFTDCITATKANGLVEPGQYTFGADGKMEKPYTGIKNVDGVDYYYLNGKIMKNSTGLLVQIDDDIYYVTPMGKIKKNFTNYITATKANGLVAPGEYTFGEDGKMIIQ